MNQAKLQRPEFIGLNCSGRNKRMQPVISKQLAQINGTHDLKTLRSYHSKAQRGFTLLELMISMTLTTLLLGMLSAGIYGVVNDWQDETSGLDESIDKALIILQLERAMSAAFPHSYIHPQRLARFVYFYGTESEVRFISTISPQRHVGLTAWQVSSSPDNGVQLKLTPAFSDNPDLRLETAEFVSLLPNYEARFRYLVQRGTDEKEWLEQWPMEQMQSLPLAIEIVFSPLNGGQDMEVLEILAPIKAHQHENIDPTIPVF